MDYKRSWTLFEPCNGNSSHNRTFYTHRFHNAQRQDRYTSVHPDIMATSPHRPFFSSFLAAFRAHSSTIAPASSSPTKPATSLSPSSQPSHSSSTTSSTSANTTSHPRSIASNSKPGATTSALTQLHSPRTGSSPLSTSPGYGAQTAQSNSQTRDQARGERGRFRRGSDSSSEGFRDVLGAEKWYIGGRTAGGEERFFKLGVVRRERSVDRLSLDRLSL